MREESTSNNRHISIPGFFIMCSQNIERLLRIFISYLVYKPYLAKSCQWWLPLWLPVVFFFFSPFCHNSRPHLTKPLALPKSKLIGQRADRTFINCTPLGLNPRLFFFCRLRSQNELYQWAVTIGQRTIGVLISQKKQVFWQGIISSFFLLQFQTSN